MTELRRASDVMNEEFSSQIQSYINFRVRGLNPTAAARAAHFRDPVQAVIDIHSNPRVDDAIAFHREMARQTAINAASLEFTKDDATRLYLEAHAKSATATEEIKAVDSLVKLHGLAEPEKVRVEFTTREQLREADDTQLMELAGTSILLSPEDYCEVYDDE